MQLSGQVANSTLSFDFLSLGLFGQTFQKSSDTPHIFEVIHCILTKGDFKVRTDLLEKSLTTYL